jgi:arylsulfatase A-like enzyme
MGFARDREGWILLLVSLAAALPTACGRPAPPPPTAADETTRVETRRTETAPGETSSHPDILLVTVDTLRPDHLSAYGHPRPTSPRIDALARDGIRFERAYAPAPWTVPSVATLLTSLYPEAHGVTRGVVDAGAIRGQQVLDPALPRLPGLLRAAGYRTFGITANEHLAAPLGFAAGFDRYVNLGFDADAGGVGETLAAWRGEIDAARPAFVWLHYFDPHAPYLPRRPWLDTFAPLEPEESWRLVVPFAGEYESMQLDDERRAYVEALYDAEVAFVDRAVGEAVDLLDPDREAVVLVAADHGEAFGEHGRFGHDGSVDEELIRVPLIVRLPGARFAGRVVDLPVGLVDVGPTLLDQVRLAAPAGFQGRSLVPLFVADGTLEAVPLLASLERGDPVVHGVVDGDWKYVRYSGSKAGESLFDLRADPEERHDLAADAPDRLNSLAARLDALRELRAGAPATELRAASEERLERLRSLGYAR